MSAQHLRDLERALSNRGWEVREETQTPGSDRWGISGTWILTRGPDRLTLSFEGADADGVETYPVDRAYACHVSQHPDTCLWFTTRTRASTWQSEVLAFATSLDELLRRPGVG